MEVQGKAPNAWQGTAKRVFDLAVASVGLILASPLLAFFAVIVRLSSRGPIFFLQERIGRGGRPFRIIKFRTMVEKAPALGGALTAGHRDPRITRVGRFLRKTKIDELPQLVNVLKGEMSLVGPRPEVRKYVELFRKDYEYLLTVRPGLTDPASLAYRDEAALLGNGEDPEQEYVRRILPDKIALSRQYVERMSPWLDLKLIMQTALTVFR